MKEKLKKLFGILPFAAAAGATVQANEIDEDAFWQKVYDVRTSYFEENIGAFPQDILKMGNMTGVWPGGGLFVMPGDKLGKGLWVYTTFGLSNPDMPASTMMDDYKIETDEHGRASKYSGTLKGKEPAKMSDGSAGYGYEILLIARENAEWPLWFIQWSVNAEILNDAGILERVEKYNGLTVQEIQVGDNESVNVLIAKAQKPLPAGTVLPNGRMALLVATVITEAEMKWSMENGREELLKKLIAAGVGQISDRHRDSVVK